MTEFVKYYEKKHRELFLQRMVDHPSSMADVNNERRLYDETAELRHDLITLRKLLDEFKDKAENKETKKICAEEIAEIDLTLEN